MSTPLDSHANAEASDVYSLYTPAMLAELLDVPARTIRRWHRQGYLQSHRDVRRLPSFDFAEIAVARHLTTLLNSGCSLATIDRKLSELRRSMPEVDRPLCDSSVVISGQNLMVRRGEDLAEPSGQLWMEFQDADTLDEPAEHLFPVGEGIRVLHATNDETDSPFSTCDQLQFEALKLEDQGELARAAEVYRTLLMAREPTAEIHFALADLLYRMGDLAAARERFYAAIELDEEYVEARASLGCVLAELGEFDLAVAAFQGALAFHAEYADVHYHLAIALVKLDNHGEAELHLKSFLSLAPESPWAEAARAQLNRLGELSDVVLTT